MENRYSYRNGIAGGHTGGLYAISDFGTPAILGVNTYTRAIYRV